MQFSVNVSNVTFFEGGPALAHLKITGEHLINLTRAINGSMNELYEKAYKAFQVEASIVTEIEMPDVSQCRPPGNSRGIVNKVRKFIRSAGS